METILELIGNALTLNPEQHIFLVTVFSLSVTTFALYLVLLMLKKHDKDK